MARRYVQSAGRRKANDDAIALLEPDYGTPERWQHSPRAYIGTEIKGVCAAQAEVECVLDKWRIVGGITQSEHEAGLKLRADYFYGQIPLRADPRYDGVRAKSVGAAWSSPAERRSPKAEHAYQSFRRAIAHVGTRSAMILIHVCCEDGDFAWQRRDELRTALQRLEDAYKIKRQEQH